MKLFFVSLLFSQSLFATTPGYEMNIDLSIDGKHIFGPRIITPENKPAMVTQTVGNEGHYIEVVAKEEMLNGKNGILMTFVVGKIDQAGKRTVLSAPQIFANENQKAQITVGNTGQPEVSVSVMAERKAL